jgi:hypothetical protein
MEMEMEMGASPKMKTVSEVRSIDGFTLSTSRLWGEDHRGRELWS